MNKPKKNIPDIIPRDVLFGNPDKIQARISPDGKYISFLAPSETGVLNIWVRSISDKNDQMVTNDTYRGIRMYAWSYDNQILYLQDLNGDENYHVYRVDIGLKEIKDLTPFSAVKANTIFVHRDNPHEILVGLNKRDEKVFDMYRINLKTGDILNEAENPGDVSEWFIDNNFKIRALIAENSKDGSSIVKVRNNYNEAWRILTTIPFGENFSIVGFTEDNKNLLCRTSVGGDTTRLVIIDFNSGKEIKEIVTDDKADIEIVMTNDKTHTVEAVSFNYKRRNWVFFDNKVEEDFKLLKKDNNTDMHLVSRNYDDNKWVVVFEADDRPLGYYLFDRETKKTEFLFYHKKKLEKYSLSKMNPHIIKARDGLHLVSYLTIPSWLEPEMLPMVLLVHGGPWARDSWGLKEMVQWLANRGYAVLQVNYRASSGFGKKFLNAGNEQWGTGSMQHDLTDAVKWAVDEGIADPERIAIMGGSYGGFATLAGVVFTPDLYKCGVDIVGPSNLKTLLETIPPYWQPLKKEMVLRIGDVEKNEEFNKKVSPLFHIENIKVPLLIGQGQNDPRVKITESNQIVEAMRKKNLSVEYIVFPDEGHGFARPENKLDFYGITENFLAQHIGGRKEPYKKIKGSKAEKR